VSDAGCGSRVLRLRRKTLLLFWREEFETVCLDYFEDNGRMKEWITFGLAMIVLNGGCSPYSGHPPRNGEPKAAMTGPGAVSGIVSSSGDNTAPAGQEIKQLKGTYSYTDDSVLLRDYWKPGGVVNSAHAATLNAWLRRNESGVDIPTFLYSSQYIGERAKAVADLISGKSKVKTLSPGAEVPGRKPGQPDNPSLPVSDSDALRNYWKPNGVVNAEHAAALRAWLSSDEKGIDIATFIDSPTYATERPKAVAALLK
jgi:hypothetical protein